VLRFWDDRTGSYAELAVKPSIPLRVCIHGPADGTWSGLADLRVLLVADVLTRIAELHGLQVIAVLAAASPPPGALDQDVSALGIHPPAACIIPAEAERSLGGPAHVHLARNTAGLGDSVAGLLVEVGLVEDLTHAEPGDRAAGPQADGGYGGDRLALRLALLSRSHREPVKLTQAVLADAAKSLGRWRRAVAEWASQPSRPIPPGTAGKIRGAFDEDLNTVAALDVLHDVESRHDMPTGAKFETFVFVDRVLGLELAREIGRPLQGHACCRITSIESRDLGCVTCDQNVCGEALIRSRRASAVQARLLRCSRRMPEVKPALPDDGCWP